MNVYLRPLGRSGCLRRPVEIGGFRSTAAKPQFRERFSTSNILASQQRPGPSRNDTKFIKPSGYYYNPTQLPPDPSLATSAEPRRRPPYLLMSLGATLGSILTLLGIMVLTNPPPTPGSERDAAKLAEIESAGDKILRVLAQKYASYDRWMVLDPLDLYYGGVQLPILARALASSGGLPHQRILFNSRTGEFIALVFFGDGGSGWPKMAHGGMTATAVLIVMEMVAAYIREPGQEAPDARSSEAEDPKQDRQHFADLTALHWFDIDYVKKMKTGCFYLIVGTSKDTEIDSDNRRGNSVTAIIYSGLPQSDNPQHGRMAVARGHFLLENKLPEPQD